MKKRLIIFIQNFLETFAVIIFIFSILTFAIGKSAGLISNLFQLGSDGLAISTIMQLCAFSFLICLFKLIFLSDLILKNTSTVLRYILFFLFTAAMLVIFALAFKWIPNVLKYWILVFVCYLISTISSIAVSCFISKKEDEKLNNALNAIKRINGEE